METLAKLDGYKWCGHCAIMNRYEYPWQDREYVLKGFGDTKKDARKFYREFVKKAIVLKLTSTYGVSLAETARQVGILTSGAYQILRRSDDN